MPEFDLDAAFAQTGPELPEEILRRFMEVWCIPERRLNWTRVEGTETQGYTAYASVYVAPTSRSPTTYVFARWDPTTQMWHPN